MAFNRYNVKAFFEEIKITFCILIPPPTRIWYLDETGVNTDPNSKEILCRLGTKQVGQIKSGERSINITMCCWNGPAASIHISQGSIYKSDVAWCSYWKSWLSQFIRLDETRHFLQVFKHFIYNMSVSKDQPGVLIMDNHSSNITIETVELAEEHNLSLLRLPPHCSHKLQALDVGVFGAFNRFYTSFCDE